MRGRMRRFRGDGHVGARPSPNDRSRRCRTAALESTGELALSTETVSRAAMGPRTAYLLAATSMIIYSSPPVVTRAVSLGVPPLALSLARWVIAFVILLPRSEEHTSELQSRENLVCRLLLE